MTAMEKGNELFKGLGVTKPDIETPPAFILEFACNVIRLGSAGRHMIVRIGAGAAHASIDSRLVLGTGK
jgi:hypothetical protein